MKKILCINYSQSGQLDEILDNFTRPLTEEYSVERVKIYPKKKYPFPWNANNFYDEMPETVLEEPTELAPFELKEAHYDLIIFGYQPWFLSPSLPATSLLKNETFKTRLKDTPVVTVTGARNMWLNAQESIVKLVEEAGGRMVGHIAMVDRAPNQLSAVSIVHWMMTGKKTRKWGIFPLPGVSQEDIDGCGKFGETLKEALQNNKLEELQSKLIAQGAVEIKTSILFIEGKAKKIFNVWARIIKKKEAAGKNRAFWISFFRFYLNFALFVVAPILVLIYSVLIRPFTQGKIREKKQYYAYLGMNPR